MQEDTTLTISRYLKLTSLQESKNGFKGITLENRNFECLCSDNNAIFLVSDKEILRLILDKELTNWVDYKELAKHQELTLDDAEVTIQLQPKAKAKAVPKAAKPQIEAKATKTTSTKASPSKTSKPKTSTKKATSATKK